MRRLQFTLLFVEQRLRSCSSVASRSRNTSCARRTFLKTVCQILPLLFLIIGNFGFGIDEHIDLGIKYDPSTGIYGMDFYVVLARAGKRVKRRKAKTAKFGNFQRIRKDESKQWFIEKLGGTII